MAQFEFRGSTWGKVVLKGSALPVGCSLDKLLKTSYVSYLQLLRDSRH